MAIYHLDNYYSRGVSFLDYEIAKYLKLLSDEYHINDKSNSKNFKLFHGTTELNILIPNIDNFELFKWWCTEHNALIFPKKKMIDSRSIWWPSIIEFLPPQDDEYIVLLKMKYLD